VSPPKKADRDKKVWLAFGIVIAVAVLREIWILF
jgi:hypothetical protein